MFHEFESRLTLEGTLTAVTALRIGAGRSTDPTGPDLTVVKDTLGGPYIPGSSFKGVLRSTVEAFMRATAGRADDPTDDNSVMFQHSTAKLRQYLKALLEERKYDLLNWPPPERTDKQKKRLGVPEKLLEEPYDLQKVINSFPGEIVEGILTDTLLTYTVEQLSCPVSRLFGSTWLASKVQISDLGVSRKDWFGQYQVRNGVAIDRDTETASDGKLYDYQVVPAGTQFSLRMVVENAENWQLGMLWLGLRPFRGGEATLGGGVSRGLGVVQLTEIQARRLSKETLRERLAEYALDEFPGDPVSEDDWRAWTREFAKKLRN